MPKMSEENSSEWLKQNLGDHESQEDAIAPSQADSSILHSSQEGAGYMWNKALEEDSMPLQVSP